MAFHRVFIVAWVAVLATGMTTSAFAGCGGCGWEGSGPAIAAPPPVCGGDCGARVAPALAYGRAAAVFAPVAPLPVAPAPIAVDHWDTNGFGGCGLDGVFLGCGGSGGCGVFGSFGGCGGLTGCAGCGRPVAHGPAPTPIYVVNQGPQYSGPGFMIPFKTYSPATGLAWPGRYPYISGRGYGPHYAHRYRPEPPANWERPPLGVRG
jgi:hypothetical protein